MQYTAHGPIELYIVPYHIKYHQRNTLTLSKSYSGKGNLEVIPQQAEMAQGVPGSLRSRIFLTFGTTRVVGRQSYAPAAFTPGEIPGTHFQKLSRPQGTWFCRGNDGNNPQ